MEVKCASAIFSSLKQKITHWFWSQTFFSCFKTIFAFPICTMKAPPYKPKTLFIAEWFSTVLSKTLTHFTRHTSSSLKTVQMKCDIVPSLMTTKSCPFQVHFTYEGLFDCFHPQQPGIQGLQRVLECWLIKDMEVPMEFLDTQRHAHTQRPSLIYVVLLRSLLLCLRDFLFFFFSSAFLSFLSLTFLFLPVLIPLLPSSSLWQDYMQGIYDLSASWVITKKRH